MAASNHALAPGETTESVARMLSQREQRAALAAMRLAAADHTPIAPPRTAPDGVRWSDVPQAVLFACDDVEAAVVQTLKRERGYEFTLRTIEDWPGRLIIIRTDDHRVYVAQATIGRFGDHGDREQALLKALKQQMLAFGRKRSFKD